MVMAAVAIAAIVVPTLIRLLTVPIQFDVIVEGLPADDAGCSLVLVFIVRCALVLNGDRQPLTRSGPARGSSLFPFPYNWSGTIIVAISDKAALAHGKVMVVSSWVFAADDPSGSSFNLFCTKRNQLAAVIQQ